MGKSVKYNVPSETSMAKKQQKKRDQMSIAQAMKSANTGIALFRRPPSKKV